MDDPTHIAAILAALANGDDPFTGLPLPAGHVLTDVRVKAALAAAAARIDPDMTLDQLVWREPVPEPPADDGDRKGKAWTDAEQERLIAGHDAGSTTAAIASELGRSPGAVRSRLVLLGLITVISDKGDARFLDHFERGHLLGRCVDDRVVLRAARLLARSDPAGAALRLTAALDGYAARDDAPAGCASWDPHTLLAMAAPGRSPNWSP